MKVYTTMLKNDVVILNIYKSIKEFLLKNRWCDNKFINITTTKDLRAFEFSNEKSMIIYSDIEKKSHALLREVFLNGNK